MKNSSPLVSVVIPTFNRADLIARAIESVLRQSHKDYEIIVVDDGSSDGTKQRLRPYMSQIRYQHQRNQGVSAARNTGIMLARGEWIATLDSDDTWHEKKLELQLAGLTEIGSSGVGACFTNCTFIGEPTKRFTTFEQAGFQPMKELAVLDKPMRWILGRQPIIWIQSLLVKRELITKIGGFDTQMVVGEDTDFLFRLSLNTKLCFIKRVLVNIDRVPDRADRLTRIFDSADGRAFCSGDIMLQKWLKLLEDSPDVALKWQIKDSLIENYYYWLTASIKRSQWSKIPSLVRKIRYCGVGPAKYLKLASLFVGSGMRKIYAMHGGG